ncbi:LysR family transcriptional regulator [Piscinibacter sakaiensis]|uniref:Transcriptional regulator, LysR family n=1 Tax=Piscinibacter sakaiensis TaxID=1547922 RepID=A0A0K8P1W4_PISS1|nr:LysR family transcriptional regulator [Piscinibacter sakaiensis]GAP36613.1 transcriptional regulator, LysR family [Piscinibacter sakaiensis]
MNDAFDEGGDARRFALLQTFVRIVDAGSLSAAARRLATTQPTVSRRLQALERALGVRLLQRNTHTMALTEDGERCLAHARELLERWQAFEGDLRGRRDAPRGSLRVQVPHAFGQDQLIAPLAEFLNRHPLVQVEWLLHDHPPDFVAGGIDCAIRVGPVEDPGVVALRLAEVSRIVVAAPGLWGAGAAPADPDALAALPWVALQTYYRDEVQLEAPDGAPPWRIPIRPRLATDSLYAVRQAVRAGLGAALVSAWVVAEDLARGELVRLAAPRAGTPLPVSLTHPPLRFPPARLRAFAQLMRERMPGLAGMQAPTPGVPPARSR